MKIIDWNISYAGDTARKIEFLQEFITEDTCVLLQEVKPHAYHYIKEILSNNCEMVYSLDYRKPSKFDSDARKLGVLILASKDIEVIDAGVIERSPFPDRTAYATLQRNNKEIKIMALHSVTGCGYYRAKSVQYDTFAEFIDEYCPDIIGIDANEPQLDHWDIRQMQFFDNGPGAKHFFNEVSDIGLVDTYARFNGEEGFKNGLALVKSHNVRRKGAVRYDFLFVRESYKIKSIEYCYDEAVAAGSDHAIIIGEIEV